MADKNLFWKDIKQEILNQGKGLITKIEIFDLYQGDKIPSDKKSIAFHLRFQASDRTLEMPQVDKIKDNILNSLKDKFNIYLRD